MRGADHNDNSESHYYRQDLPYRFLAQLNECDQGAPHGPNPKKKCQKHVSCRRLHDLPIRRPLVIKKIKIIPHHVPKTNRDCPEGVWYGGRGRRLGVGQ